MASFLSLSAELRNRVYDGLLEEQQDDEMLLLSRRPSVTSSQSAFGLMHVNRQLRAEFRPLFLRKQRIAITLDELTSYLRCFYRVSQGTCHQHARLVILGPHASQQQNTVTVDLMLLVRLLCDSEQTFCADFCFRNVVAACEMRFGWHLERLRHHILAPTRRRRLRAQCSEVMGKGQTVGLEVVIRRQSPVDSSRKLLVVVTQKHKVAYAALPPMFDTLRATGVNVREF